MTPGTRDKAARDLLTFYVEAGVDAALGRGAGRPLRRRGAGPGTGATEAPQPPCVAGSAQAPAMPTTQAPPPPEEAIMAARAAARSAATLEELRAIMNGFEGCALKTTAKQLVFGDGSAEGAADVRRRGAGLGGGSAGHPVCRPLRAIARQDAGRDRDRTVGRLYRQHRAVAAAGKPRSFAARNRRSACPSSSARSNWSIRMCWSVSASRRRRLCSASPTASRRTADAGLLTRPATRDIRAMPTFHPAFLLRSPIEKRFAWRDFLAIKKALAARAPIAPVMAGMTVHRHRHFAPGEDRGSRGKGGKTANCHAARNAE